MTPTTARWLALATAVLLAVGVISAGVVDARRSGSDPSVVTAASNTTPTVDVPSSSTTTVPSALPAVTPAPPSTVARSTTVPKAAAAVLAAIGTTAPPTTQPPATTTTRAPVPPTTATTATTSTTVPRRASATFVNRYPDDVVVTVGGRSLDLARNEEEGPVDLALEANGSATIDLQVAGAECTKTTVRGLFEPGVVYRLAVVVSGPPKCEGFQQLNIVPA